MIDSIIRNAYKFAIFFFAIFFINIVIGKVSLAFLDRQLPMGLDGALEFLVLFVSSMFFVTGILSSEQKSKPSEYTDLNEFEREQHYE